MADNVAITAGSGTTVATDELTINAVAAQVQRVKNVLGADGTYTADQAGRVVSGSDGAAYTDPRPKKVRLSVTPTISAAGIYAAKDAVGALMTFANAARFSGGSIVIEAVQVADKDQELADLELLLFDRSITAPTDNAVFDPTDTESTQCIGSVYISRGFYADLNDNSVAAINDVGLSAVLNGTDLYGVLVARSTPTYTATTDLTVTLTIRQD